MHPSQSLKYSSEQAIAALKQGMANTKRKDNVPAMTQTLRAIALAGDDANTRAAALAHLGYIACYLRGDVIFGKKKLQEALATRYLDIDTKTIILWRLAEVQFKFLDEPESALINAKNIARARNIPPEMTIRAKLLINEIIHQKAIAIDDPDEYAISIDDTTPRGLIPFIMLHQARAQAAGLNYRTAEKILKKTLTLVVEGTNEWAEIKFELGRLCLLANNPSQGKNHLLEALDAEYALDITLAKIHLTLGNYYRLRNNVEYAAGHYFQVANLCAASEDLRAQANIKYASLQRESTQSAVESSQQDTTKIIAHSSTSSRETRSLSLKTGEYQLVAWYNTVEDAQRNGFAFPSIDSSSDNDSEHDEPVLSSNPLTGKRKTSDNHEPSEQAPKRIKTHDHELSEQASNATAIAPYTDTPQKSFRGYHA
ncbi:MAG: hypothetical protein CMF50_07235 [Legionellales bacterium]|nr:hypothetical protein [Legionellales bacterium]|tara:strand:+ start:34286 stop:35563 length:1278 start_codon:yes stop_codon:yes gene_type:complete